jgi:hypothetical protein
MKKRKIKDKEEKTKKKHQEKIKEKKPINKTNIKKKK